MQSEDAVHIANANFSDFLCTSFQSQKVLRNIEMQILIISRRRPRNHAIIGIMFVMLQLPTESCKLANCIFQEPAKDTSLQARHALL